MTSAKKRRLRKKRQDARYVAQGQVSEPETTKHYEPGNGAIYTMTTGSTTIMRYEVRR